MMNKILIIAILMVFFAAVSAEAPFNAFIKGRATFYGASEGGACGFGIIKDPDANFGVPAPNTFAIMHPAWAGSSSCGQCYEVKGSKGTITVLNDNICPDGGWCDGIGAFHMDLNQAAFAKLDNLVKGVIETQIRRVACPVKGNLKIWMKEGSSVYWMGFRPFNHRYAVSKLEFKEHGGAYVNLPLQDSGHFYLMTGGGSGVKLPVTVRVTSEKNQQVEVVINDLSGNSIHAAKSNFPLVGHHKNVVRHNKNVKSLVSHIKNVIGHKK